MKIAMIQWAAVACASLGLLGGLGGTHAQSTDVNGDHLTQVVEVSAKEYEFAPSEIRVKKGAKVELKVHSVDQTHGLKLDHYPGGSKNKSGPGLVFERPEENGKVEKDQDQFLDFVAQQPGTYHFKCAKICGMHHGRMKGTVIVEE